jgi:flagellar hook protein FlgE
LSSISIGQDGTITGGFTNGQTRTLGSSSSPISRRPTNSDAWAPRCTRKSLHRARPPLGTPATADRGSVTAGTLEQSNVDISKEFIRMIAAQRSFEANSKTLTTADQLLSELMQIKR